MLQYFIYHNSIGRNPTIVAAFDRPGPAEACCKRFAEDSRDKGLGQTWTVHRSGLNGLEVCFLARYEPDGSIYAGNPDAE